jgi:hypothetical protein
MKTIPSTTEAKNFKLFVLNFRGNSKKAAKYISNATTGISGGYIKKLSSNWPFIRREKDR